MRGPETRPLEGYEGLFLILEKTLEGYEGSFWILEKTLEGYEGSFFDFEKFPRGYWNPRGKSQKSSREIFKILEDYPLIFFEDLTSRIIKFIPIIT